MLCSRCELWELAKGDRVCSWCGADYLRFSARLLPAELPVDDYPPPVHLHVRNDSPVAPLLLERVHSEQGWITVLAGEVLPRTLPPGTADTLLLDVDPFAAGADRAAAITLHAKYADAPVALQLHLR